MSSFFGGEDMGMTPDSWRAWCVKARLQIRILVLSPPSFVALDSMSSLAQLQFLIRMMAVSPVWTRAGLEGSCLISEA